MCGFIGVFHYRDDRPAELGALQSALNVLSHRGPDARGTFSAGPVALAHCRLKVIDLTAAGDQPMGSDDGRFQLVYNGEIYNFRELRRKHRLDEGYRFRSTTDTEVLLHLFEKLGPPGVSELNGMFAFAVWDARQRELFLARDPFGIKPLFYCDDGRTLWFASEVKALLAAGAVEPRPDLRALQRYLQFDYIPGDLTAFKGVQELRPGHWLRAKPEGGIRMGAYWKWPARIEDRVGVREAVEQSRRLVREAVERQLVSDVPVGVMLSGGMDSSTLAVLMARVRGDPDFHTFSLAFPDPSFDESNFASLVAERVGTRHHVIRVTPEAVWESLRAQSAYIDEPYADGAAIPTYLLSRYARDYVTVLLSGEGGDEVFAGYDTHLAYKARKLFLKIPPAWRGRIAGSAKRLPVSHRKLSLEFRIKRFSQAAEHDVAGAHFYWRAVASSRAVEELTGSRLSSADDGADLFHSIYDLPPSQDPIGRLSRIDCAFHFPDDLMIKCDRMTMPFSLEARVPFTDLELVRYAMALPDKIRLPRWHKKYLLRQAMKGLLPEQILRKKKMGMEIPYSRWFCREWKERTREWFYRESSDCGGLLDPAVIRRYWEEHLRRVADHGRLLWGLLNYLVWYDLYLAHPDRYREYLHPPRPPR